MQEKRLILRMKLREREKLLIEKKKFYLDNSLKEKKNWKNTEIDVFYLTNYLFNL